MMTFGAAMQRLVLAFLLLAVFPLTAMADSAKWVEYRAQRNLQASAEIADCNLAYDRWLLRSRSLKSVYLGFPLTRTTYDKRYILPDPEAVSGPDIVFKDPKFGLRIGPEGIKLAFVGLPYEKKWKLYDISSKVRVRVELYFDRKKVAHTKIYEASPVGFLLPLEYLDGLTEGEFLELMQEEWQWRVEVFYDGEIGYVYSGPLDGAKDALGAARDELKWRLDKAERGGVSVSNDDFW